MPVVVALAKPTPPPLTGSPPSTKTSPTTIPVPVRSPVMSPRRCAAHLPAGTARPTPPPSGEPEPSPTPERVALSSGGRQHHQPRRLRPRRDPNIRLHRCVGVQDARAGSPSCSTMGIGRRPFICPSGMNHLARGPPDFWLHRDHHCPHDFVSKRLPLGVPQREEPADVEGKRI